jgi:hypothetical protein
MKKILLVAVAVIGLASVMNLPAAEPTKTGTLRHVVVFKYKPTATPQQIQKVTDDFRALKKSIPGIASFETGTNISPENLNQGFTHCYILTFKTAKARDAYLVHPAHKKFAESLGPVLAEPFVIDFWAGK